MESIQVLDRIAIELGPITIYWYGIIIATGAFLGFIMASKEMSRLGYKKDHLTDLVMWAIPIAIISARIYYVIFKWGYFSEHPGEIIAIWNGGIAIHGALIGSVITAYIFTKKRNLSFWQIADVAAPSILLGQAIGRWGNFMNQEAHGGPMTSSLVDRYYSILPDFMMDQMYIEGTYYYPTFLYESIWSLIGVGGLLLLRKVNLRQGELFLTYVIWYSVGRFFIEGMRTDSLMLTDSIRMAQFISVALIIGAGAMIAYRRNKKSNRILYDGTLMKR